jgi:hypothetical protein
LICDLLEVQTKEVPTMSSVRSRGRMSVRSFDEGRGVHARRHVRRPGRVVKHRMGHTRRRERS